jgi:tetratricopeptide (TPR) repeat protein
LAADTSVRDSKLEVGMAGSLELSGACFERAVAHHQAGQLIEAVTEYQAAVAHFPEHQQAWNNLGTAQLSLKRLPEAIEAYQQALKIDPDYAAAAYNLGTAYQAGGRNKEAYTWFREADRLRPDDVNTLARLAGLSEAANLQAYAAHLYQRIVDLSPENLGARGGLSRSLSAAGRIDEAKPIMADLLVRLPQDPGVWYLVGEAHLLAGDWDQAIRHFEHSAALAPQAIDVHMQLAMANLRGGRFQVAFDLCQVIVEKDPNYGAAVMVQSQALKGLGRHVEAEFLAARGRELPGNAPAWIDQALSAAPAIPFDRQTIQHSRERLFQLLDDAVAFGGRLRDPSLKVDKTAFYFAYHGHNDRPLMVRLAETFLALTPDLAWVAPHCARTAVPQVAPGP